jgi:hypothetical protein
VPTQEPLVIDHFGGSEPGPLRWTDHDKAAGPYRLLELTETRTTWHPVGV